MTRLRREIYKCGSSFQPLLLVLLTAGAQAQFSMDQKKKDKPPENPQHKKAEDKAFEKAQQLVPNSTAPQDPWGNVRSKKQ